MEVIGMADVVKTASGYGLAGFVLVLWFFRERENTKVMREMSDALGSVKTCIEAFRSYVEAKLD